MESAAGTLPAVVQGVAEGNHLIPVDGSTLAKTILAPGEFLQFRTWWQDHAETLTAHNQTHNILILLEQLMGDSSMGESARPNMYE